MPIYLRLPAACLPACLTVWLVRSLFFSLPSPLFCLFRNISFRSICLSIGILGSHTIHILCIASASLISTQIRLVRRFLFTLSACLTLSLRLSICLFLRLCACMSGFLYRVLQPHVMTISLIHYFWNKCSAPSTVLLPSKNKLGMEYTSAYFPDTVAELIVSAVGTRFMMLMPSAKSDLHMLLMQLCWNALMLPRLSS